MLLITNAWVGEVTGVRVSSFDVRGHHNAVVLCEDGYTAAPEYSVGDAARGRRE
jgi:hypothetical protein